MIVSGSINYTTSGRKRKVAKKRGVKRDFVPYIPPVYRAEKHIPSAPLTPHSDSPNNSYKREISKNYTVSIPFNKGGYQVISKEDVKYIGR